MTFITKLNAGTVVDRAGLNKLKTEEMATTLAELYKDPAVTVLIVDNVQQFFSVKNLMAALDDNSPALPLLLEQKGITLTDEDIDTVRQFSEVKQHILDTLEANKPPAPPYPFADVPEGWTVESHIRVTKSRVARIKGSGGYYVSLKGAERLWRGAAEFWAGNTTNRDLESASYGGFWREPTVNAKQIDIGCQTINRYELEQLALNQGWAFPEVKAED